VFSIDVPEESSGMASSVDVHFVDQKGIRWRRNAFSGDLSLSPKAPFTVLDPEDDPLEEDGFIEVQFL
jgi:hypothetical protein